MTTEQLRAKYQSLAPEREVKKPAPPGRAPTRAGLFGSQAADTADGPLVHPIDPVVRLAVGLGLGQPARQPVLDLQRLGQRDFSRRCLLSAQLDPFTLLGCG